jgi:outer membrane receptor for ferrienterochelin and colicins
MYIRYYTGLFFTCFFLTFSLAQNNLKLVVRDSTTSENLVGAIVQLTHTGINTTTDVDGNAELKNIPDGEYIIAASLIGYKSTTKKILFPLQSQAQPMIIKLAANNRDLEQVTITSTRTNSRIEDLPMKVEVLGQEDLEEENGVKPGSVMSQLGDLSIIHIQQTSAVSGSSSIRMQGLDGKYTQLLRDGLPLYEGFSGSFGILQLPPLDLKQVEIIKGSVSTLYGGGAIGGMINFISKEPTDSQQVSLTLNQTTLKETNTNIYYSNKFGKKVGFTLFAGGTLQEAVDVNGDGFSDVPEIKNVIIHPRLFLYFNPKTTLNIGLSGTFEKRLGGDMTVIKGKTDSLHKYYENNNTKRNTFDFHFNRAIRDNQSLTIKGTGSFFARDVDQSGSVFSGNQLVSYTEASYLLKTAKHQFVTGTNFMMEQFLKNKIDSSLIKDYNYQTVGLFLQDGWQLNEKFLIETGLRTDYHNTFGWFVLPRIAFFYKVKPDLSFRLSGGTGYKAPNVFTQQTVSGNFKKLLPLDNTTTAERSTGINLDVNHHVMLFDKISVQLNQALYFTHIDNPITVTYDALGTMKLVNGNYTVNSTGADTYLRFKYEDLELYFGYNHTIAQQLMGKTSQYVAFSPHDKFSTTLAYDIEGVWRFGIEGSWIGNQYIEPDVTAQNFWFFAGMIQRKIGKFSIVLNCENIFDFRQSKYGSIILPPVSNPRFESLWGPIDGRIVNLSVRIKI